ncbi:glycoside hydrolase family 114 protein, partial [Piromyces sp. E2]
MKFSLLSTALLATISFVSNAEALWKPTVGSTWNYVLGHKINLATEKAEVLEIDVNKSASLIQEYHNVGKKVICYFSGGTIEDFRDDKKDYEAVPGLVRNTYEAWDDEKWLDFRIEGIKPLIIKRMKLAVSKNCDGIEVDNVDAYQMKEVKSWTDPITREQTVVFLKWLGSTAHSLGISIGLKNVNGLIDEVGQYFDFAINEDCHHYNDECRKYKNFLASGKPVFAVAY